MPERFKFKLIVWLLVITFVLVPLTLYLLGRGQPSRRKRILSGLCLLLLGGTSSCLLVLALIGVGVLQLEWRGGYVPTITPAKTMTDLAALARSRAEQNTNSPAAPASNRSSPSWPGFRGANRDGVCGEPILMNWPATGLRKLWSQPCGGGYSSFAIAEGRAFTLEQRRENEVAVAYDVETGRELWTNAWPARFTEWHSDEGPRGTPTYDDGKVYVLGATGEFRCLDAADGKVIWGKNVATENGGSPASYGIVCSPLIVGEKLVLFAHGQKENPIACYDKRDGKILWRGQAPDVGYSSPVVANFDGERHIIVPGRPDVVGLRLEDGVERWRFPFPVLGRERPIAQPLMLGTNRFMVSAAYMTGSAAVEVTRSGNGFQVRDLWRSRSLKAKFSSPVFWQGFVYGLDEDILTCIEAQTGERKWKDGRYGYGQILLASGHLVIQCANGDLALVKATPDEWREVARVPGLHGKTWNVPAIAGGRLLVRNGAEMACFDISPATQIAQP